MFERLINFRLCVSSWLGYVYVRVYVWREWKTSATTFTQLVRASGFVMAQAVLCTYTRTVLSASEQTAFFMQSLWRCHKFPRALSLASSAVQCLHFQENQPKFRNHVSIFKEIIDMISNIFPIKSGNSHIYIAGHVKSHWHIPGYQFQNMETLASSTRQSNLV